MQSLPMSAVAPKKDMTIKKNFHTQTLK